MREVYGGGLDACRFYYDLAAPKWSCARDVLADVLNTNPDDEGLGADAAAGALRYLVATPRRTIAQCKLRNL